MDNNSFWRCLKLKISLVQLELAAFYLICMQVGDKPYSSNCDGMIAAIKERNTLPRVATKR